MCTLDPIILLYKILESSVYTWPHQMTMLLCIYFLCVVLNTATDLPDQQISHTMVNLDTENQDKENSQKKEFEVRKF